MSARKKQIPLITAVAFLMSHSVVYAAPIFPASLVSYWNFDESASGTAPALDQIDSNNGTFLGSASHTAGLTGTGAALFNNTIPDEVNVGAGTGNNFSVTTGITVEALIQPGWSGTSLNYDQIFRKEDSTNRILLAFQNDSGNSSAIPAVDPGKVLSFGLNVGGAYSELDMLLDGLAGRPTLAELKDGEPHHVVATYDSSSGLKAIYIDGTLRFSTNLGASNSITSGGGAGASIGNKPANEPFTGVIDEVAFYNAALSASEIANHFANAQAGKNYFEPLPGQVVPAFNEWGIFILIVGLACFAVMKVRRVARAATE